VRRAPIECLLVAFPAAAIIVLPIETGMAIGIGLSLLHGVAMTVRTRPVELQKLPGTTVWWPPAAGEPGERQEGVTVIGFHAPLLFANAATFKRGMIDMIQAHGGPPRLVVLEASGIADVDFTAARAPSELIAHCHSRDHRLAIAPVGSVRAQQSLDRFRLLAELAPG